jgi:hypothetical protein
MNINLAKKKLESLRKYHDLYNKACEHEGKDPEFPFHEFEDSNPYAEAVKAEFELHESIKSSAW